MDLTPHLPDLLSAARIGLAAGDAALAVDPAGARALAVIDRGAAELRPELVDGLGRALTELAAPVVLLLRRPDGRPTAEDGAAWAALTTQLAPEVLVDALVVGDAGAWSLRAGHPLPDAAP